MRRIALLLPVIILLCSFRATERDLFISGYFQPPVADLMRLSGTFGELRSNHFHAGLDIKGGMNVPILAAADGYVSRISVSGSGYGNALYIDHPKGYTTLYGHLNAFSSDIADYVRKEQEKRESFSVELYLKPGQFPVKQGEQVALMGTTGSSSGPHLHFEIRDSETEKALNPLKFGLNFDQSSSLRLHQLKVYELDEEKQFLHAEEYDPFYSGGEYNIRGNTITVRSPRIGLALKAYDHMNGGRNWNGIYGMDLEVDEHPIFRFRMDAIGFEESLYINAHLDYREYREERSYYNRCFLLPGNKCSIYQSVQNEGFIELEVGERVPVRMRVLGVGNTERILTFWLEREPGSRPDPPVPHQYWLEHDQDNIISNFHLYMHLPQGAIYQDLPMTYNQAEEASFQVFSPVHSIHEPLTPVHKSFTLGIRPTLIPDELRDKAFIGRCTDNNRVVNYGGEWKDGMLVTRTRTFGDYAIMVDEEKPDIRADRFQRDMRGWTSMRFRIDDNLPTSGMARSLSWRATVDGKWALLVHDAKRDRLTYEFPDELESGEHSFRLEVTDAMGNVEVFEESFLR